MNSEMRVLPESVQSSVCEQRVCRWMERLLKDLLQSYGWQRRRPSSAALNHQWSDAVFTVRKDDDDDDNDEGHLFALAGDASTTPCIAPSPSLVININRVLYLRTAGPGYKSVQSSYYRGV